MKIIAITNQKGGVAKTTTAVNLSAGLVRLGYKVLLIDSDPQSNATIHMGVDPSELELTLDDLYYRPEINAENIILNINGLHLLPAAKPLSYAEQKLAGVPGKEFILSEKLNSVKTNYDFAIIDCPPNLGFLTVNAFNAANDLIITVKPEFFALEGLTEINSIIEHIQRRLNPDLALSGYVITDYDHRKNQHKAIRKSIGNVFQGKVFDTMIRTNSTLSDCTSKGMSIFDYNSTCNGAIDYLNLAKEVEANNGR